MNVVSFKVSYRTIELYLLFLWWCEMMRCLHVERKWSEWHRHTVALLMVHKKEGHLWVIWIITPWVGIPGGMELDCMKFHHTTQNGVQFKLMNCFWNFPLNIFGPGLMGHWNHRKRKQGLGWGGGPLSSLIKRGKRETTELGRILPQNSGQHFRYTPPAQVCLMSPWMRSSVLVKNCRHRLPVPIQLPVLALPVWRGEMHHFSQCH